MRRYSLDNPEGNAEMVERLHGEYVRFDDIVALMPAPTLESINAAARKLMEFRGKIDETKAVLTLPLVKKIADNEMPECFEATRETVVALAQLLMTSLEQLDKIIAGKKH